MDDGDAGLMGNGIILPGSQRNKKDRHRPTRAGNGHKTPKNQ